MPAIVKVSRAPKSSSRSTRRPNGPGANVRCRSISQLCEKRNETPLLNRTSKPGRGSRWRRVPPASLDDVDRGGERRGRHEQVDVTEAAGGGVGLVEVGGGGTLDDDGIDAGRDESAVQVEEVALEQEHEAHRGAVGAVRLVLLVRRGDEGTGRDRPGQGGLGPLGAAQVAQVAPVVLREDVVGERGVAPVEVPRDHAAEQVPGVPRLDRRRCRSSRRRCRCRSRSSVRHDQAALEQLGEGALEVAVGRSPDRGRSGRRARR